MSQKRHKRHPQDVTHTAQLEHTTTRLYHAQENVP